MARELVYSVEKVYAVSISSKVVFVTAVGKTRTSGWKSPQIKRVIYVTPPADGYQEYMFSAMSPTGPSLQMLTPIAAEDTWVGPPSWLKGVRITAETNQKKAPVTKLLKTMQAAAPKKKAAAKKRK